jgi:hypothetical protein
MFRESMPGAIADVASGIESGVDQIKEYLGKAVAFVSHAALNHPNEFVIALSAVATAIFAGVLARRTAGLFRDTEGLRQETSGLIRPRSCGRPEKNNSNWSKSNLY